MTSDLAPQPSSRGARAAVFAQLSGAGRSEQVAQRLIDAILLGVLTPGDRLPSEAELAQRFGVALVTAREALSAMRDAGLVETRRGREGGSFVLPVSRTPEALLWARLRGMARVDIEDSAVYFGVLSAGCTERAAELASDEESARLRLWLENADFATVSDAARNAGGFYLEIAVISQSPRLVREQIRLQAEFGSLLWLGVADEALRRNIFGQNVQIAEAISAHDPERARALVRAQLSELSGWLLAAKERIEQ
ncbi:FadR/GntR family transcriptional regulator [Arthrobacter sp. SO3]|uniref:FadR/GntR family transcriptional regulator n=1 Tax=Arthrobacter sp. SO3 TaxID=1897057 RepID=UPI001D00192E|nr:GntR family transcriptional regulator [Arthrobacter sp. SO3]MCB5291982.1 putative HTH-type transcriptional regulator [Arthrobacter sp. SO3]